MPVVPVVAAAATGLLLAACSGDPAASPSAPTSSSAPTSPAVTSAAPPATTPVPAPTPGSTKATVPSQKLTVRKPVRLDAQGEAADGVTVRLTKVAAVKAKAVGPGEVSGPALAFTVAVHNGTGQPVDLGSTAVNVTAADDKPASQMSGKPANPLHGSVAAAGTATGVYVFTLAKNQRDPVTVQVTVRPADPIVVFRGRASR